MHCLVQGHFISSAYDKKMYPGTAVGTGFDARFWRTGLLTHCCTNDYLRRSATPHLVFLYVPTRRRGWVRRCHHPSYQCHFFCSLYTICTRYAAAYACLACLCRYFARGYCRLCGTAVVHGRVSHKLLDFRFELTLVERDGGTNKY